MGNEKESRGGSGIGWEQEEQRQHGLVLKGGILAPVERSDEKVQYPLLVGCWVTLKKGLTDIGKYELSRR